jgi:hypothetical protein
MYLCRRCDAAGELAFMSDQKKPTNLRTALILLSVAVVFFIGVIAKQYLAH